MSNRLLFNFASITSRLASSSSSTLVQNSNFRHCPRLLSARCFSDSPLGATTDGDGLQTGTVQWYYYNKAYGFIIPDGVNPQDRESFVFVHKTDIVSPAVPEGEVYNPRLRAGVRVQYKLSPANEGGKAKRAREVTAEGGGKIPAYSRNGYLDIFAKNQKARFGDEVFEIMETSTDQQEMESRIVAAFEKVKESIDRERSKGSATSNRKEE